MTRSDIIRMAREANIKQAIETPHLLMVHELERFAALVVAAERERIKQANAPEIEKVNAHIKALEAAAIRARGEK